MLFLQDVSNLLCSERRVPHDTKNKGKAIPSVDGGDDNDNENDDTKGIIG